MQNSQSWESYRLAPKPDSTESPEGETVILAEKRLCSHIPFLFSNINRLQKNESKPAPLL